MSDKEINIEINSDSDNEKKSETAEDKKKADEATTEEASSEEEPKVLTIEETLAEKVAELEDKLLRAQADYENARKRTTRLWEDMVRTASDPVISDILEVIDNFERAMEAKDDENNGKSFRQGMEMIYKQLNDALTKRGVRTIEAVGKKFDPNFHEAMLQIESDKHDEGTVVQEISKGYMKDDRVLRHSRVAVSKAKASDNDETKDEDSK